MGFLKNVLIILLAIILGRTVFYDLLVELTVTPSNENIDGKRVLVTGASKGIGEQIAYHYCKFGAHLIITARNQKALDDVKKKCEKLGNGKVYTVTGDMGVVGDVKKVINFTLKQFENEMDHVILNHVGGPYSYGFFDGDMDKVRKVTEINYFSYVQLATALIPALKPLEGSLVVISSVAGRVGMAFTNVYSGCKFAIEGFFGSLQKELALLDSRVSISIVAYGLIDTESAHSQADGVVRQLPYSSAEGAALTAIKAALGKSRDLMFPWWTRSLLLMRDWGQSLYHLIEMDLFDVDAIKKRGNGKVIV